MRCQLVVGEQAFILRGALCYHDIGCWKDFLPEGSRSLAQMLSGVSDRYVASRSTLIIVLQSNEMDENIDHKISFIMRSLST